MTTSGRNTNTTYGDYTQGPAWDPAGQVSFRAWLRELGAWLNVTGTRLNSRAQAAAIQRGLQGLARDFALSLPSAAISFGGSINEVMTDPVTYLIYTLSNRFESLEED